MNEIASNILTIATALGLIVTAVVAWRGLRKQDAEAANLLATIKKQEEEARQISASIDTTATRIVTDTAVMLLAPYREEVVKLRTRLTDLEAALHATRLELEQAQRGQADLAAKLARTQAQLEQTQAQLARTHAQLEQTQAQLEHTQTELMNSKEREDALLLRVQALEDENAGLLAAISEK